ncbi:MAG: hypothetical protein WBW04_17900 [Nitrolancea sp.]
MIPQRVANVLLAVAVGFAVLFTGAGANAAPTGFDVAPEFQAFYLASSGLSNFGYAVSGSMNEGGFLVQYFERQRFENHTENAGTPYQVELGRLGADSAQASGVMNSAAFQPISAGTTSPDECTFFAETGHQVCGSFRAYWGQSGVEFGDPGVSMRESVALFGYPISEEFQDPATGLVVQYFERARFEHHPEFAGTQYEVELTLLGDEVLNDKSGTNVTATDQRLKAKPASGGVLFGVYPGGGNGELGYVAPPSSGKVVQSLNQLRGDAPFNVHLYTAWSWYDQQALDTDVKTYTDAGFTVTLTIKYSPPSGHEGDNAGFSSFVRRVVDRYGKNPKITRFVIGNEINVASGNSDSSDGPIAGVRDATILGVSTAKSELSGIGSTAQIGIDIATLDRNADAQFLHDLVQLGGSSFNAAISFVGINVYPGLWPVGTGDPYGDMASYLRDARYALGYAGLGSNVTINVLENGYPTLDETVQASRLGEFVRAVCDNASSLGISGYSWFDLWDANSSSGNVYGHYGLFRSDLTPKPALERYQQLIASQCVASP